MPRRFRLPEKWPAPADGDAAERLIARFSTIGHSEAALASDPALARVLRALGGNSPYLADLAVREHESFVLLREWGPERVVARILARLRSTPPELPRERIAAALREAKRQAALTIAVADIGGSWRLEHVSRALSDLADAALTLATRHLLLAAHDLHRVRLPSPGHPDRGSGFVVLGMGKLGARELNYSSDVDLVLLYDPLAAAPDEEAARTTYTRLARDLVGLMEGHDSGGYVFRMDLRLRPDPAATAPAVSLPAAISYYESMAQNWERAAMIKARPVAGDRTLGQEFLEAIRPFVWRRYLDFAAIADIRAMRQRVAARSLGVRALSAARAEDPCAALAGYNVKRGAGGIRTIEFLAQTLQLVWGGRDRTLRVAATLPALAALAKRGVLAPRHARALASAYRTLRRTENRLQMVGDHQTQTLPATAAGVARFMLFLGRAGGPAPAAMATRILRHLKSVEARYHEMTEPMTQEAELSPALDLRGIERPSPVAREALAGYGFANVNGALAVLAGWQNGRLRALRTERARELLMQVLPEILGALARQHDPDTALAHFDTFLARLSSGVQTLSLFQHHPSLLERTASVLGAAPWLAEHLARNPAHLDGLLSRDVVDRAPARTLTERLRGIRGLEPAIGEMRAFVHEEEFRIAVATLDNRLDVDRAGLVRTALAETAVRFLLPRVIADFAARLGELPGGEIAVVALGKAGGREMMAGSDLDLMLIYDYAPEVTQSQGARALAPSEWFIRAAHAFIAALSSAGAEGPIYAVDMRLRPSGSKGPVAVSLSAFQRYHASNAWIWERMALTRARVVAAPAGFGAGVEAAIRTALTTAASAQSVRAAAASMRGRIMREHKPSGPWDVRYLPGGSLDVDFIAQALQLIHAPARPSLWSTSTREALARLGDGGLLSSGDARLLRRADYTFRTIQGMLRVALGTRPPRALPEPAAAALLGALRAAGEPLADLPALARCVEEMTTAVRAIFTRTLGAVEESRT